jgi:hypothetical protein
MMVVETACLLGKDLAVNVSKLLARKIKLCLFYCGSVLNVS